VIVCKWKTRRKGSEGIGLGTRSSGGDGINEDPRVRALAPKTRTYVNVRGGMAVRRCHKALALFPSERRT
jgi:hypothetical protein